MGKKNKGREDEKCYTSKDLKEESRKKVLGCRNLDFPNVFFYTY